MSEQHTPQRDPFLADEETQRIAPVPPLRTRRGIHPDAGGPTTNIISPGREVGLDELRDAPPIARAVKFVDKHGWRWRLIHSRARLHHGDGSAHEESHYGLRARHEGRHVDLWWSRKEGLGGLVEAGAKFERRSVWIGGRVELGEGVEPVTVHLTRVKDAEMRVWITDGKAWVRTYYASHNTDQGWR